MRKRRILKITPPARMRIGKVGRLLDAVAEVYPTATVSLTNSGISILVEEWDL